MNHPLDLTVMMYHYVRDPGDAAEAGTGIPGLPVGDFERQLDELAKQYTLVTWLDVLAAVEEGHPLPELACLLTFDDGVRDHYINAFRILRERSLSGLFFILDRRDDPGLILAHKIHFLLARLGVTGLRDAVLGKLGTEEKEQFKQGEEKYQVKYPPSTTEGQIDLLKAVLQRDLSPRVEPLLGDLFELYIGSEFATAQSYYLTSQQIQEMASGGMYFGGHSRSHPWFDWIDAGSREEEIELSAAYLRGIALGPWAFAYPYGGLSEDCPSLLQKHGFAAAFTTRPHVKHSDPYFIGRLDGEEIAREGNSYA